MAKEKQQLFDTSDEPQGPVECLGMTFENDAARREHFLQLLREKLKDPEFRAIEGFPIGEDEDILALSDPPYYTACPNPFMLDFVLQHGTTYSPDGEAYHRKPMAVDVSEGKSESLYAAHGYHTKVPHKAIMKAILHYTEPGDVVLDGFSGSGMTGVAAQMCGSPPPDFKIAVEEDWKELGHDQPRWGRRIALLSDLSPFASSISSNYNLPFDDEQFYKSASHVLAALKDDVGWMYETSVPKTKEATAQLEYTVWSEVFGCPDCGSPVVFVREALESTTKKTRKTFPCPQCGVELSKKRLERRMTTLVDPATGDTTERIQLEPIFGFFKVGKQSYEKPLDEADLSTLQRIEAMALPAIVPTNSFPIPEMYHGSRLAPKGFTHIHHLFLPRQIQSLGRLREIAWSEPDRRNRNMMLFFVEQAIWGMSLLHAMRQRTIPK